MLSLACRLPIGPQPPARFVARGGAEHHCVVCFQKHHAVNVARYAGRLCLKVSAPCGQERKTPVRRRVNCRNKVALTECGQACERGANSNVCVVSRFRLTPLQQCFKLGDRAGASHDAGQGGSVDLECVGHGHPNIALRVAAIPWIMKIHITTHIRRIDKKPPNGRLLSLLGRLRIRPPPAPRGVAMLRPEH